MNPRDSFIYKIFTNWHTRERLHYQNILVFRQNRKKKDSQSIMTRRFAKHHNTRMAGIIQRSYKLFVVGLSFYNHLTLKGSLPH